MNSIPNINKSVAAERPNIQKIRGPEGVQGRGVYFGELPGDYSCLWLFSSKKGKGTRTGPLVS